MLKKLIPLLVLLCGTTFGQVINGGVVFNGGVVIQGIQGPPPPPPQISSTPCGNGVQNQAYTCQVTATSGTPPYTFSTTGTLPTGLNPIDPASGLINGTPTVVQTTNFTVIATDTKALTGSQAETVQILAGGCGPPLFPCSTRNTTAVQYPAAPFSSSTTPGTIKYDTSLNPSGTNPIIQISDITTCGGSGISTVGISGGDERGTINSNDTLIVVNCGGGVLKAVGFNLSTLAVTGVSSPILNSAGGTTFAQTPANALTMYSLSQSNPKIFKTVFTSTNPPVFTQTTLITPSTACGPLIPASGVTGGSLTIDATDTYLYGVMLTATQNSPGYIFRYNIATGKCTALSTVIATNNVQFEDGTTHTAAPASGGTLCLPIGVHNGHIYLSGNYGRFSTGTIGACTNQPIFWQLNTTNVWGCGSSGTGHDDDGFNVFVQSNNPHLMFGDLTAGNASFCAQIASQSYGTYPYQSIAGDLETHFNSGGGSSGDTYPIITQTGYFTWDGTPWSCALGTCAGVNEVLAYFRSGANFYARFTHTWTSGNTLCPKCDFRTSNGIGSVSPDSKLWEFSSDMLLGNGTTCTTVGTSGNVPCQFVYVVRLD